MSLLHLQLLYLSDIIGDRANQKRNKTAKHLIKLLSGGTQEGAMQQTSSLVKSLDHEQRLKILKEIGAIATVPANHIAAIKANLNLPWHQLWQISRCLKTFHINMASEK